MHNEKTPEKYMKECLELARLGEGHVSPNPLVGSIVLDKDGNLVGKGYHEKHGEAHAEINALNQAGNKAEGGTIYVSLEPCSHYGKTPPCIDRIIAEKIKTLVIGMIDPNPLVSGKGIKKAKDVGIEVIEGVLTKECEKINEIFVKNITQKQPFIVIKTASTIDGKIATSTGSSKWITSESAREEVQRLRNKYDAIITGSGTVIADNPSLNCRSGRNPARIIIDSQLKTSPNSKVYNDDGTNIIIAASEKIDRIKLKNYPEYVKIIKCPLRLDNKIDLEYLVQKLYEKKIFSILVEAGGTLNGAFLKYNLVDKAYFFIAPKIIGDNTSISSFEGFKIENINDSKQFSFGDIKNFSSDIMIEGYLK
jgi:diaminohydroxyphosphoribosylaminopyrimidine deaminase/5-amino-6-(5-phosphoribosylamino)uracil reductase